MNKNDKDKIIQMLDDSIKSYRMFRDRDDYLDKPCVRREVILRQSAVFNLADYLHRYGFITWEQCCEYWTKVNINDVFENEVCPFTRCGGNVDGICKYTMSEGE